MTWHLKAIPKIVHYFWDNRPLSFLRWASINSFAAMNPDWKVKLHMTADSATAAWPWPNNKQVMDEDYRSMLEEIEGLELVHEVQFPGMHGVHQSDILRNEYLAQDGGLWADVDILFYRPMSSMLCNLEQYADYDCGLCVPSPQWLPIAFMMAAPGAPFFTTVHKHQMAIFEATKGRGGYQKFGSNVYKNALKIEKYKYIDIAQQEVYQAGWRDHSSIFAGHINMDAGIGIHWYGGSPSAARFEPQLNHKNWRDSPLRAVIEATL